MSKWHLLQDQPLLREMYNEPPIISYKRAKSLGGILVRAKLQGHVSKTDGLDQRSLNGERKFRSRRVENFQG